MAREISESKDRNGQSVRDADRRQRAQYEYEPEAPVSRESVAPVWGRVKSHGETARTIVGLMAFTTVFALVSTEIETLTGGKSPTNGVRVIIGGGLGTIFLLVISEAGDAGASLAEGLALVTTVAAVLVKGGPVWSWLGKTVGAKPRANLPTEKGSAGSVLASGTPFVPAYVTGGKQ